MFTISFTTFKISPYRDSNMTILSITNIGIEMKKKFMETKVESEATPIRLL